MTAPSCLAVLLLFCGARAWPDTPNHNHYVQDNNGTEFGKNYYILDNNDTEFGNNDIPNENDYALLDNNGTQNDNNYYILENNDTEFDNNNIPNDNNYYVLVNKGTEFSNTVTQNDNNYYTLDNDTGFGNNDIPNDNNYYVLVNNGTEFSNNDTLNDNHYTLQHNNGTEFGNKDVVLENNGTEFDNNDVLMGNYGTEIDNNYALQDNYGTSNGNSDALLDNYGTEIDNNDVLLDNNGTEFDNNDVLLDNYGTEIDNNYALQDNYGTSNGNNDVLLDNYGTEFDKNHILQDNNVTSNGNNRSSKVLNFFPIPVSVECLSDDGRRTGECLNTYECRIQGGKAHGPCALGFGVCCVFTATCGSDVINNVTYFVSPAFPALSRDAAVCSVKVQKMDPSISQLRLDFVHFNLGQPNRRTGVCDSDVFLMSGGVSHNIKLCGQNSGQHVYYDVENVKDPISIIMNLTHNNLFRMWEIKITQVEFNQRAPAGCRQYYRGSTGIIQTMNFADNGRHLADQDYNICTRQEEGMCSIAYEPCDENSFKIGPPVSSDPGSGDGALGDSRECDDKIVMPCDSEEFITPDASGPGVCDLLHCGSSFCTQGEMPCRIESSTTPFNIRVQFGPGTREESPEDNLGMCLRYEQLPCYV